MTPPPAAKSHNVCTGCSPQSWGLAGRNVQLIETLNAQPILPYHELRRGCPARRRRHRCSLHTRKKKESRSLGTLLARHKLLHAAQPGDVLALLLVRGQRLQVSQKENNERVLSVRATARTHRSEVSHTGRKPLPNPTEPPKTPPPRTGLRA